MISLNPTLKVNQVKLNIFDFKNIFNRAVYMKLLLDTHSSLELELSIELLLDENNL